MVRQAILPTLAFLSLASPALGQVKTLVFCASESPDSFNPQLTVSQGAFDASSRQLYDRLVAFRQGGYEIEPALASSWEILDGGTTYIFNLRQDAPFHRTRDFRPSRNMNAEDVVFSFMRQFDKSHPWHEISGQKYRYFTGMGLPDLITSITATGEYTVTFRLNRPSASFLAILAMDFASILSAEYAEAMISAGTPELLDQQPIGTGPFQLVQYHRDALIRYVAHKDYWRGRAPLDNLVFAITPDASVRLQKLRDGECHVMDRPDSADLPSLLTAPDIRVERQTGFDVGYLAYNTRKPFLNDVRVRRALSLAIDRKAIVDRLYDGQGVPATHLLPLGVWLDDLSGLPAANPERARAMLAETNARDLEIDIWAMPASRPYMPSARRAAEMIRDAWAEIGVKANVVVRGWSDFLKLSMVGEHDVILFGWIGETLDPDVFLPPLLNCEGAQTGGNRSGWCDPGLDRLLLEARISIDPAERHVLYRLAMEIVDKQVPVLSIAHSVTFTPIREEVINYRTTLLGGHYFYGVDLRQEKVEAPLPEEASTND